MKPKSEVPWSPSSEGAGSLTSSLTFDHVFTNEQGEQTPCSCEAGPLQLESPCWIGRGLSTFHSLYANLRAWTLLCPTCQGSSRPSIWVPAQRHTCRKQSEALFGPHPRRVLQSDQFRLRCVSMKNNCSQNKEPLKRDLGPRRCSGERISQP